MGKRRAEGKGRNKNERMERKRKRESWIFTMLLPQFFEGFLKHNFALW